MWKLKAASLPSSYRTLSNVSLSRRVTYMCHSLQFGTGWFLEKREKRVRGSVILVQHLNKTAPFSFYMYLHFVSTGLFSWSELLQLFLTLAFTLLWLSYRRWSSLTGSYFAVIHGELRVNAEKSSPRSNCLNLLAYKPIVHNMYNSKFVYFAICPTSNVMTRTQNLKVSWYDSTRLFLELLQLFLTLILKHLWLLYRCWFSLTGIYFAIIQSGFRINAKKS